MARRDTTAIATPNYTPAWVNVLEWKGLTPGDPVKITGERGDFTFISVHEKDGEVISVIVRGGVYGHITQRAFYPDRVVVKTGKRSRKTAPQPDTDE